MKIVVCMKRVPNTTEIKIDPVTKTLKRDEVANIINPDDKTAIEAALRLKDRYGAKVTAVSMGAMTTEPWMREALAMGVDEAVLVSDMAFAGSDTLATSTIMSKVLERTGYDVIICGRQSIDGDTAQVGPQIAELLGLPQVTYAVDFEYDESQETFKVKRLFEDRYQWLEVKGKFLMTVMSTLAKPRYMNVWDIVDQDNKEIIVVNNKELGLGPEVIGLNGSPTKVRSTATKELNTAKELVETDPDEAAAIIVKVLAEKHLI